MIHTAHILLVVNEILYDHHKFSRNSGQLMFRTIKFLCILAEQLHIIQQIHMRVSPRSDLPLHLTFVPFSHSNCRQIDRMLNDHPIILCPRSLRNRQYLEALLDVLLFHSLQRLVQQCYQLAWILPHYLIDGFFGRFGLCFLRFTSN